MTDLEMVRLLLAKAQVCVVCNQDTYIEAVGDHGNWICFEFDEKGNIITIS